MFFIEAKNTFVIMKGTIASTKLNSHRFQRFVTGMVTIGAIESDTVWAEVSWL